MLTVLCIVSVVTCGTPQYMSQVNPDALFYLENTFSLQYGTMTVRNGQGNILLNAKGLFGLGSSVFELHFPTSV